MAWGAPASLDRLHERYQRRIGFDAVEDRDLDPGFDERGNRRVTEPEPAQAGVRHEKHRWAELERSERAQFAGRRGAEDDRRRGVE